MRARQHPADSQDEAESENERIDVVRVAGRIDSHEKVCAERWAQMLKRMDRVETIMVSCAGALLLGMGGIIVTLLTRHA